MTFRLSKNFHGVGIGPLSKILAVNGHAAAALSIGNKAIGMCPSVLKSLFRLAQSGAQLSFVVSESFC